MESAVIQVGNDSNAYWLLNTSLSDDDRIEFIAGDVIGYYQPPDISYQAWLIETDASYIAYANVLLDVLMCRQIRLIWLVQILL